MLKLYGFAVSNYFNMVKHALLAKGVPFEEVTTFPGADAAYLNKSPMGKVPCIETEHGCLAETSVILDYLEAAYPQKPLSPADLWGQAKMKEIIKLSELYIELQGRRLMPAVMQGAPLDDATRKEVRATMEKGAKAIAQLALFKPYVMGEKMTMADIFLRYSLVLARAAGPLLEYDLGKAIPGLDAWEAMMAESDIAKGIDAEVAAMLPGFMEYMKKQAAKPAQQAQQQ